MKRHDTHLLSDESEKNDQEEEDAHQYNFSKSSTESNNSKNDYISKGLKPKSPIKLGIENNKNNDSIISSSEIADIFQGKKETKEKKKKKPKKNKLFIKLKKVRLNKDKENDFIEYNLTFTPTSHYDLITDYKKQKSNSNINGDKNINYPVLNTDKNIRIKKDNKNMNTKKNEEKEIFYFFYNDDFEGNKNLKKIINLINKQKIQLLKVSNKNCFTIKTSKVMTTSEKQSQRNRYTYQTPYIENNKNNGIEKYQKIRREKINYSAKNNYNNYYRKSKNYLNKENNKNNLDLSLQNQNKMNYYQCFSNKNSNINNDNYYRNFKKDKDKVLHDLYCGKYDNYNNNINTTNKRQRIKSTDSIINNRQKQRVNQNMNNLLEREEYYPEYIRFMEIHDREKENRKIIKNMFRRAGHNYNDVNRHVGNDLNCPICQAMQMKNENNIKIKGIHPLVSSASNNSTQNSWQNRRIYSALSRILTRRKLDKTGCKSSNISHTLNMNKSNKSKNNMSQKINNISNISKISGNKLTNNYERNNIPFRKLNINRSNINQNQFPNSNKMINFRNKNIKYN